MSKDRPGILVPPPAIYIGGLAVGWLLERYWPTKMLPASIGLALGLPLVVAGVLGLLWAAATMWRGGTTVNPYKSAVSLTMDGPFRYSRNPIYVADVLLYGGLALVFDWLWALALLPLVLIAMHFHVIVREERHLERKFGEDYLRYKRNVRRWV